MRIVSLVPSVTETLAAWGVDPIACTRASAQALGLAGLPQASPASVTVAGG